MLAVMVGMVVLTLWLMQLTVRNMVTTMADNDLERARRSCARFLAVRDELLGTETATLAAAPRLRALFEQPTIDPSSSAACLAALHERCTHELLLLTDPGLMVVADDRLAGGGRLVGATLPEVPADGSPVTTLVANGRPYRIAVAPIVVVGRVVGHLVVGQRLDTARAIELCDLTGRDVLVVGPAGVAGVGSRDGARAAAPADAVVDASCLHAWARIAGNEPFTARIWGEDSQAIAVPLGAELYAVLPESMAGAAATQARCIHLLAWAGIGAIALAVIASLSTATRLAAQVRGMTAAAQRVAAGHLETRVPVAGSIETRTLAATFNGMVERVTALVEDVASTSSAAAAAKATVEVRTQLLANMSHEMRTPMNGVLGMCEILLHGKLDAEQREHVATIQRSAEFLLTLISDILDFARADAGRVQIEAVPLDLRAEVEDVVELLAPAAYAKGLDFVCVLSPELPPCVLGDPGRLRQVLINLLGNAIKFTAKGEAGVEVRVVGGDGDHVRLSWEVHDTGMGIPRDVHDRLFEAFVQADPSTTRRFGGSGLGLAISRRLVDAMGGRLELDSEVGRGTRFRFVLELPLAHSSAPAPTMPRFAALRVLGVDDGEGGRRVLRAILEPAVGTVECVDGAAAALARLGAGGVDLAVVDHEMASGDGIDLVRRIRELPGLAGLPVVLLTTGFDVANDPRLTAATVVLRKPTRRAELLSAIERLVAARAEVAVAPRSPQPPRPMLLDGGVRSVLLAEDNLVNQRVAVTMLQKLGCRVEVAENGRAAVAAASRSRFDLILMDCNMPEMDGYQATRAIRAAETAASGRVLIVALTANASAEDREKCLASGMDDFVTKPFRMTTIQDLLAKWRESAPAAGA